MTPHALFGRYWSADSIIHQLDPRTKILGTLVLVVALFFAGNAWSLAMAAIVVILLFPLAHVPINQAIRSIAPLMFIVVLTALFNILFVQGGAELAAWGPITISEEGLHTALFTAVRLTLLLLAGSLLTLTTTSIDITEAFERLLTPFARIGFPAHEFGFVMGVALRFVPQFAEELHSVRTAQLSRGAKLSTSPLRGGLTGLVSLIVPLFASVFRHADTLSSAMEARCYHGAAGRTRLHPLSFGKRDALAACALAAVIALVLLLDFAI